MLTLAQLNDDTRCTSETDKALLATPTSTMHNDDASRGTRQPLLADRDVIICLDDDITMARSDAAKSADLTRFNRNAAAPVLHGNNADSTSANACQKQMDIPTFFAGLKKSRRNRHSLDENSNSISACLKPSTTSKTPPPQAKSAKKVAICLPICLKAGASNWPGLKSTGAASLALSPAQVPAPSLQVARLQVHLPAPARLLLKAKALYP